MILSWKYSDNVVVTGDYRSFVIHKHADPWGMTGTTSFASGKTIEEVFADLDERYKNRTWPFEDVPKDPT